MNHKMQEVIIFLGWAGEAIGLVLATLVLSWAILKNGVGEFWNLRIGTRGWICLVVSIFLIWVSGHIDKRLR